MKTLNNKIDTVSYSSDLRNIQKVEDLVDQICQKFEISEDHYGNILIAVTEAVNNAIIHGNHEDKMKNVIIDVNTTDKDLNFTITDEGDGFAYDNLPDPTAPENIEKEQGRGIFLMNALADEVVFLDQGTKVSLSFTVLK